MPIPCRAMSQAQTLYPSVYSDCICLPGTTGQLACSPCPQGFWCPGNGVQNQCPANSMSPVNATSSTQCICIPGYMLDLTGACVPCPFNETCISGIASPCGPYSQTLAAGQTQCICVPGYYSSSSSSSAPC